jgi:biopolymer transport protein ExbB
MFYLALFENTFEFFRKGGVFMGLLLACSFVALTVILLRAWALRRRAVIPPLVEREINNLKVGESPEHLRRLAQDDESALARIVAVAVRFPAGAKSEAMEVVQSRARQEIVRMESGLFILEIVVGIAPLLGLLGAVSGLVRVFSNIGSGVMSTSDLKGIASGIGALIAFSYFSRRVERLAVEMEALLTDLVEKVYQYRRISAPLEESQASLQEASQ